MALCPRCGVTYGNHSAISRRDNKTPICSHCGLHEALFDLNIELAHMVSIHMEEKQHLIDEERQWLKKTG